MKPLDPVAEYLARRKAPAHLVSAGIAGLIERWRGIVDEIAQGYAAGLDDYLNDLDLRQMLHELERDLPAAWTSSDRTRLRTLDRRCRSHLVPCSECLWGRTIAAERSWTAKENWWYFEVPRTPGVELARDLERAKSG